MSCPEREHYFDIHGLTVRVHGDWPAVVEALRLDYAWFETSTAGGRAAAIDVRVEREPPNFRSFGDITASFVTDYTIVYPGKDRTIIEYTGRAVSVVDTTRNSLVVQGEDEALVRRAAFDFILSRAGDHLDAIGLPRMHGAGLVGRQGAVVVMLPMGGGKTTIALRAVRENGVRVLSEGSPLIDRHGRLHAFPLPMWVRAYSEAAASLPAEHIRRVNGVESNPRILELAAFADRIERRPTPLRHIVLGRRSLAEGARLEQLPRRAAVRSLMRDSIIGFGFFQGLEFVMRTGVGDLAGRLGTTATRVRCCTAGLLHADVWRLTFGRDHDRNWAALRTLLD
jgi:hypothetical protein